MKRTLARLNSKATLRVGTTAVALAASGTLALTMWFIMQTLNEVAAAKTSNGPQQLRIVGVSTPLLEKAMLFKDEKASDARLLGPDLPNPFARPAPARPTPQPQAAEPPQTPTDPAQ